MMKDYQKDCKNLNQVNSFLKSIRLEDFVIDTFTCEFDFDGWTNDKETKGVSVNVTTNFEVYVTKYTKKDVENFEEEWGLN